jgi:23S rRNA (adenine2030-N6)-methyltransferase
MELPVMRAFERSVAATRIRRILQLELAVRDEGGSGGLRGCGLLVVNPPFGFDAVARSLLEWLWPALSQEGQGGQRVAWLAGE